MGERSIDRFTRSASSHSSLFLPPAQSVFTFLYITLLSHMGERLAVHLRTALFQSLVEQDIAFFDSHKSGELVSRYNRRGDGGWGDTRTLEACSRSPPSFLFTHALLPPPSLLTPSFLFPLHSRPPPSSLLFLPSPSLSSSPTSSPPFFLPFPFFILLYTSSLPSPFQIVR